MTTSTCRPSSSELIRQSSPGRELLSWTIDAGGPLCEVRSTRRTHGDFRVIAPGADGFESLEQRRRDLAPGPWTWLRQVHGRAVVPVDSPGAAAGATADGAWTKVLDAPVAVTTADCAPVVLIGRGAVAIVHVGWRGAEAGVIEAAAECLRAAGADPMASVLGPCIDAAHYEFGAEDLDRLVERYGSAVAGRTDGGAPALDLAALVGAACAAAGWPAPEATAATSSPDFFSHRTRSDTGRLATVAWLRARTEADGRLG